MNRPYRYAATIHPVRYFSKEFFPSNIWGFILRILRTELFI